MNYLLSPCLGAWALATMGWTVEQIAAELQRINVRPAPCPASCP